METTLMVTESDCIGSLQWAASSRTHPQEVQCGDAYFVKETSRGVLITVIDGLGHGPEAAEASRVAIDAIATHSDEPTENIIAVCHDALKSTRGAVLSLALLDIAGESLTWAGIGNVEGVLLRQDGGREWLPLRTGIVGCRMPSIKTFELPLSPDDLLIMFSDGITNRFISQFFADRRPAEMADKIMNEHVKGTDDALVLVARYQSGDDLGG